MNHEGNGVYDAETETLTRDCKWCDGRGTFGFVWKKKCLNCNGEGRCQFKRPQIVPSPQNIQPPEPWRKALPPPITKKIEHLQIVPVQDDDIMIVTASQILTQQQKIDLERGLREVGGFKNKLVILDEGMKLGFARRLP